MCIYIYMIYIIIYTYSDGKTLVDTFPYWWIVRKIDSIGVQNKW